MTATNDVTVEDCIHNSFPFTTRSVLPSKRVPKDQQSIWNIIKNAIGKDLFRLTTPIVFNEPLSFIQRLAEYTENIHLLSEAVSLNDPCDRLERVGAFAASTLASLRLSKPFNPLLLETYELEKPDMGFRFVSEQVSHHPPVSAFHVSALNGDYELYGNVAPKLRFWGRSLECEPHANFTIKFPKLNESYTWKAVNFNIYNIIMGQMYMTLSGTMVVKCHSSHREFRLNFKGAGSNSKPEFLVSGEVVQDKKRVRSIYGNFCTYLASCQPHAFEKCFPLIEKEFRQQIDDNAFVLIRESKTLWRKFAMPGNSEEYYDFSYLAMQLNEMPANASILPRTDSRWRPDIRHMENGEFELAANQKKHLEEKQRVASKKCPKRSPKWFVAVPKDHFGRENQWSFTGRYWDRKYDDCEDIY